MSFSGISGRNRGFAHSGYVKIEKASKNSIYYNSQVIVVKTNHWSRWNDVITRPLELFYFKSRKGSQHTFYVLTFKLVLALWSAKWQGNNPHLPDQSEWSNWRKSYGFHKNSKPLSEGKKNRKGNISKSVKKQGNLNLTEYPWSIIYRRYENISRIHFWIKIWFIWRMR